MLNKNLIITFIKLISGIISNSFILSRGKRLWEENTRDWNLPLTKIDKIIVGIHIILLDYSKGKFPPTFKDRQTAYKNEIDFYKSIPGCTILGHQDSEMRKPFGWGGVHIERLVIDFIYIIKVIEKLGIAKSNSKILEIGCGTGWMAELMALSGYNVMGISIAPFDIEIANKRIESLIVKELKYNLMFLISDMEHVDNNLIEYLPFDFVFVYEALHHAYSWEETFHSVYKALNQNGWFFICKEPNLVHTFVAYRGTKQLKTHEIGLSRNKMIKELKYCGFKNIKCIKNRFNNLISPHWILAQKI